jgi:hypothetical protein
LVALFLGAAILFAEQGWLVVSVEDLDYKIPIEGVAIALKGIGSSARTKQTGLARLKFPNTPTATPASL